IISFVFTYFISRLIMGFVDREHRDTKYLFASLVISTGLANLLSIIVSNIFKTVYPLVPALAMFVLLPYFYYSGTKHKDLKGTIVLLILSFVLNVVPNLFNL
ncbi:MAG: hypothetical protein LBC17_02905, partial [Lactobacillaceae bacterium]|nr:hypothetical protein [Lactobacillaceae bacterium]